jgi:hypothetical protein
VILHRNLAVLEISEDGLLEAVRRVVDLDTYVVGWLSPTEAVIDPARLRPLLDRLEAVGMAALVRREGS